MEDFKLIDSKKVYTGRVVDLSVETIVLPSKAEVQREVVHHPGAAAIVPMVSRDEVVLIRQFRYSAKKTIWEIPAGTIDPGETPIVCARRELMEETGYTAKKVTPMGGFFTSPGFCEEFLHLFLATGLLAGDSDLDGDEQLEAHVVPLEDALLKIENGDICDAKTIVGLLRVNSMNLKTIMD